MLAAVLQRIPSRCSYDAGLNWARTRSTRVRTLRLAGHREPLATSQAQHHYLFQVFCLLLLQHHIYLQATASSMCPSGQCAQWKHGELSLNAHITTKLDFSSAHYQLSLCGTVFEAEDSNSWTLVDVVASQTQHEHLGKTARQINLYLSFNAFCVRAFCKWICQTYI